MRVALAAFVTALALGLPGTGGACQFDGDCSLGSRCQKKTGQIHGVCVGGAQPGNAHDQRPGRDRDPLDHNRTAGKTCQIDMECGPGSKCTKPRGSAQGTCVRR